MLYKVVNACPSNHARAILGVSQPARTSLHPRPSRVNNPLWTSFRGFLSHSASAIVPVSLIPPNDQPYVDRKSHKGASAVSEPTRNCLYMRMTLAERDSLLKHHVARLPLYAYHLLGAYQDPHQNTVIVLADMRQSSLANSLEIFKGKEVRTETSCLTLSHGMITG